MEPIDRETEFAKNGEEAYIIGKMNSLLDKRSLLKLYGSLLLLEFIDLIVRGLYASSWLAGVSDNITVRSIVGRF